MEYRQTDGRMQRSERTRALVVEAHTALLREGVLRPTAAQIAERAGVSRRTLWSNFKDMENLLQSTVEHWFRLDDELAVAIDPELPLDERIRQFCVERERRMVNISPAARSALLSEPFSPALRDSRARHIGRVREQLSRLFGAELDAADDAEELLDALTGVTSWNFWSLLADDHAYSSERVRAIMERAVRALLES